MSEGPSSAPLVSEGGALNDSMEGDELEGAGPEDERASRRYTKSYTIRRKKPDDKWRYLQAALYLQEGLEHTKFAHHPRTEEAIAAYRAVNSTWLNMIDLVAGIVLMALAFFEQPPACGSCTNITATALVEIFCLLASHIHTIFLFKWKGSKVFNEKKFVVKMILTVEMLIEAIVVLGTQQHHLRFMRAFRPMFIIDNKFATGIKRVLYEMVQSLPPVLDVLVLLMTFITTFAVMGYYLFGTQQQNELTQDYDNWYFQSFGESWVNMFILLTTANYPDIMMPAYHKSRWAALFFISYLLCALYFLGNLLLAAVYTNFNTREKEKFGRLFIHRRQGLRKSFECVCEGQSGGRMNFVTFEGIISEYLPGRGLAEIVCMFKTLDKDGLGIDLDTWFTFYEVSLYSWKEDRGESSGLFCSISLYPRVIMPYFVVLNNIVSHRFFEYFIDLVIVINSAFLIAEAALTNDSNKKSHAIEDYEQVFLSIYTVEAVMKICGIGFKKYFSKGFNVFDFIIVAVGLFGQFFEQRTTFVTILRPFRLFRLFKLRKSFNRILTSMFNIFPRLMRFVMALVCVFYFFSVIGMESFSGDISKCGCSLYKGEYQCNPELFRANRPPMFYVSGNRTEACTTVNNCEYILCGGHYSGYYDRSNADGLYYLNNFDDIVTSYIVLFELMVVNNWHVTMQGAVTASHTNAARAFFILFYLVTVIMVTNVVVAFILDAFHSLLPTLQAREERQEKRLWEEGDDTTENKGGDEADELVRYIYLPRSTAERLEDDKFVSKLKKKGSTSAQVKLVGTRRIQPLDIYLLIFGSDIDEWKQTEVEISATDRRESPASYGRGRGGYESRARPTSAAAGDADQPQPIENDLAAAGGYPMTGYSPPEVPQTKVQFAEA